MSSERRNHSLHLVRKTGLAVLRMQGETSDKHENGCQDNERGLLFNVSSQCKPEANRREGDEWPDQIRYGETTHANIRQNVKLRDLPDGGQAEIRESEDGRAARHVCVACVRRSTRRLDRRG